MKFSSQHKIVILDDDLQRRDFLRSVVCETGAVPYFFDNAAICLDNVAPIGPDAVIAGPLPKELAYRVILSLKLRDRGLPLLVFSADPEVQKFVSHNAFTDVTILRADAEPWEVEGSLGTLIRQGAGAQRSAHASAAVIVGHSPPMIRLKKVIETLSREDDAVMVRGEPGTGKELVVRALYHRSPRCGRPLVKISIPDLMQLPGREGFFDIDGGHSRSGASSFPQALEMAAGGILFLDNVESLTPGNQAGMLGWLTEGSYACKPCAHEDVRLVFTAGGDIDALAQSGAFRKDLYFRMNGISVTVPPLRSRRGDIGLLADFFADQCCRETGRGHFDLSTELKELFESYPWPGNVRELKRAVCTAVLGGSERPVRDRLYRMIQQGGLLQAPAGGGSVDRLVDLSGLRTYLRTEGNLSLKHVCWTYTERIEKKLIGRILERTQWNRRAAAGMLGISYKSILNKIKQYDLSPATK